MPRTRKPKIGPQKVHPARIVDLASLSYDSDGYRQVTLLLPGIPPNQVEAISNACTRAILGVLEWPDDQAAGMAERVSKRLAEELAQRIEWDEASHAYPAEPVNPDPTADDMGDNIPF